MSIEAMKQALEALTFDGFTPQDVTHRELTAKAVEALRTAIQQAESEPVEPVAWLNPYGGVLTKPQTGLERETHTIPLYTHPAPGVPDDVVRVSMTDEQLRDCLRTCQHDTVQNLRVRWLYAKEFARSVEAHHGITAQAKKETP